MSARPSHEATLDPELEVRRRPFGVTAVIVTHIPLVLLSLGWNALLVLLGVELDLSLVGLALALRMMMALMLAGATIGLWLGKPMGRTVALFTYVVGLIVNAKMLLANGLYAWMHDAHGLALVFFVRYGGEALLFVACFVYLCTPNARQHFRRRIRSRRRR